VRWPPRGPTLAQAGGVAKQRFPRASGVRPGWLADSPTPLEQAVIDVVEFRARHLAWLEAKLELPDARIDDEDTIILDVDDIEIAVDATFGARMRARSH
jgi:hypothetical protein